MDREQRTNALVFLGNPGKEYEKTRHNFGWMLALRFAEAVSPAGTWTDKFDAKLQICSLGTDKLYLLKPQAFMNLSGTAVRKLCEFYKIPIESVVVIHDELELDFGQIAFKRGGGAGGHNGIRSIDSALQSNEYLRLRLGIGRPRHGDVSNHVLSRFSTDEELLLPLILDLGSRELRQVADGKTVPTQKLQAWTKF